MNQGGSDYVYDGRVVATTFGKENAHTTIPVPDLWRSAIRKVVSRFRMANPPVIGSVLHGTDQDNSDLDLLVDALPGARLLDLGDLQD